MKRLTIRRVLRGIQSRLFRRASFCLFAARATSSGLSEVDVLRVNAGSAKDLKSRVEQAMCHAQEPPGLAAKRFAHGDEFFGWVVGERIVSFGWATNRERAIHGVPLKEMPGRMFLYNFYTEVTDRGHGFYPSLLGVIRQQLGREGASEFIMDVESHNTASLRGVSRAGFVTVAHAQFLVVFNHWYWLGSRSADAGLDLTLFFT